LVSPHLWLPIEIHVILLKSFFFFYHVIYILYDTFVSIFTLYKFENFSVDKGPQKMCSSSVAHSVYDNKNMQSFCTHGVYGVCDSVRISTVEGNYLTAQDSTANYYDRWTDNKYKNTHFRQWHKCNTFLWGALAYNVSGIYITYLYFKNDNYKIYGEG